MADSLDITEIKLEEGGSLYIHPFLLLDGWDSFLLGLCAPQESE